MNGIQTHCKQVIRLIILYQFHANKCAARMKVINLFALL